MKKQTAIKLSLLCSASAIVVMIAFLVWGNKAGDQSLLYVGFALAIASIVMRNLLRFKPGWFRDDKAE